MAEKNLIGIETIPGLDKDKTSEMELIIVNIFFFFFGIFYCGGRSLGFFFFFFFFLFMSDAHHGINSSTQKYQSTQSNVALTSCRQDSGSPPF